MPAVLFVRTISTPPDLTRNSRKLLFFLTSSSWIDIYFGLTDNHDLSVLEWFPIARELVCCSIWTLKTLEDSLGDEKHTDFSDGSHGDSLISTIHEVSRTLGDGQADDKVGRFLSGT